VQAVPPGGDAGDCGAGVRAADSSPVREPPGRHPLGHQRWASHPQRKQDRRARTPPGPAGCQSSRKQSPRHFGQAALGVALASVSRV
jgi:hypothetical protein